MRIRTALSTLATIALRSLISGKVMYIYVLSGFKFPVSSKKILEKAIKAAQVDYRAAMTD